MKTISKLAVISVFSFLVIGCSSLATTQNTLNIEAIQNAEIRNLNHPQGAVFSAGQPTQEQLSTLGNAGIKHVVSLRTAGEIDWNEQEYVESLGGVTYHNIPIDGVGAINAVNAASLQSLLKSFGDEPVLLHCGSSNRVGALVAISEAQENGADADAAVEEGKRWGLTGLEPTVRSALAE